MTFKQIFLATVASVDSRLVTNPAEFSARPQTTASTAIGQLQTVDPSQAIVTQHNITSTLREQVSTALIAAKVPGAGVWSSLNINSLGNLLQKF